MRLREDVGHLGHEVHAAEDDVLGLGLGREARQAERIAGQVGVLVHIRPLVVVAEDGRACAQPGPGGNDARLTGIIFQRLVVVE